MCSCDCETPDYDDEEGEELWSDNIVVTDSAIKCCECYTTINTGEQYRHIEGCWDGDWSTYKMCSVCSAVSSALSKELNGCHCLGGLYEELIDREILFTLEDEDGQIIEDEEGKRVWASEEDWLRVVNQSPLRCEVNASN